MLSGLKLPSFKSKALTTQPSTGSTSQSVKSDPNGVNNAKGATGAGSTADAKNPINPINVSDSANLDVENLANNDVAPPPTGTTGTIPTTGTLSIDGSAPNKNTATARLAAINHPDVSAGTEVIADPVVKADRTDALPRANFLSKAFARMIEAAVLAQ